MPSSLPPPVWSGEDALLAVNGPFGRYPPVRVLYLASRLGVDGGLRIETPAGPSAVVLRSGAVWQAEGIPRLLADLGEGLAGVTDSTSGIGVAVEHGTPVDAAAEAAARGIGRFLASLSERRDGTVRWDPALRPAPAAFPLGVSVPRLLMDGLRQARDAAHLMAFWDAAGSGRLAVALPDDSPETRWGLDSAALRILRQVPREPSVAALVGGLVGGASARRLEILRQIDTLHQLGLLELRRVGAPAPSRPVATGPDPRIEVLKARVASLHGKQPVDVLGLGEAASLATAAVDAAWRTLGPPSHPDQYADASAELTAVAHQLFDLYRSARDALAAPGGLDEANRVLDARRKGVAYVSEKDRSAARVAYRRGETLFRSRAWKEADPCFQQALALDPAWPHPYYEVWCGWLARRVSGLAADIALARLEPPTAKDRAMVSVARGTLAKVEGRGEDAIKHFQAAAEADPTNRDAEREVRLEKRRASQA